MIGAGAWGTALAVHAVRLGHAVTLWARRPEAIGACNPRLPGVVLPQGLCVAGSLPDDADATLVAVPMQSLRGVLAALSPPGPLILCCKGLEAGTHRLPLEVAADVVPNRPVAVLTGPNFAHEIAAGFPAASVLAGGDPILRAELLGMLGSGALRLYGNEDAIGAQLGGAAKNVIAVAAGAVTGAGLGENARAALITRGLAEISRLVVAEGGRAETVSGLSGLGDLLLTCTGPASRNFSLGLGLGGGRALATLAPVDGPVVEAISTAPALLARAGALDLPICQAVCELLSGRTNVPKLMYRILARPMRNE